MTGLAGLPGGCMPSVPKELVEVERGAPWQDESEHAFAPQRQGGGGGKRRQLH